MASFIGIDVAKAHLDVYLAETKECLQLRNDPDGHQHLIKRLAKLDRPRVVLEATGGYEMPVVAELHAMGIWVAMANPRQVRDFARAKGRLAKTDRLDAELLAQFGQTMTTRPAPVPDATTEKIRALVVRRRQLVAIAQAEKNRCEHATDCSLLRSIKRMCKAAEQELAWVEQQLQHTIQVSALWQRKVELLSSARGVGRTTAVALLAHVPELGTLNRRQVAALVGLAPINRDSGTFRGKRMIGGGRAAARTVLYMPTLVATRFNPQISVFYQHLLKAGKSKMTALIACMRKLLTTLNAILRDNQPWRTTCA